MTANRTGGAGKAGRRRALEHDGELHVMRLAGLLEDLKRQHGSYGAAEELGVSYKMLRRSEMAGRMSDALREALERYLVYGPEHEESRWWKRVERVEAEVRAFQASVGGDIERLMQAVKELAGDIAGHRTATDRELAVIRQELDDVRQAAAEVSGLARRTGQAPEVEAVRQDGPVPPPLRSTPPQTLASGQRELVPDNDVALELVAAWEEASARVGAARTRLEQASEELARGQIGLELVREHSLLMPGPRRLDGLRQSQELERHWYMISSLRQERRRLAVRRWVRRVLTCGLWWS